MVQRSLGALILLLACVPTFAEDWLPPAKELFRPFFADPKEIGYSLRWTARDDGRPVTEIGLGDYLGIVRVPLGAWEAQSSIGGGVIGRFDTYLHDRAFEVADFTLGLPFDFRNGPHSIRFGLWHISSHMGDDFIRNNNLPAAGLQKAYTDEALLFYSVDAAPRLRLYVGGAHALNIIPALSPDRAQAGFELASGPLFASHAQLIWANDVQWYARRGDRWAFSSRLGLRNFNKALAGAVTPFVGYYGGPLYYEQDYPKVENQLTLGVKIEMGTPAPAARP